MRSLTPARTMVIFRSSSNDFLTSLPSCRVVALPCLAGLSRCVVTSAYWTSRLTKAAKRARSAASGVGGFRADDLWYRWQHSASTGTTQPGRSGWARGHHRCLHETGSKTLTHYCTVSVMLWAQRHVPWLMSWDHGAAHLSNAGQTRRGSPSSAPWLAHCHLSVCWFGSLRILLDR
jgi:hypothetical protein